MSHMIRCATQLSESRMSAIKAALVAMGVREEYIETDENGSLELTDYYGHKSGTRCGLRIKGSVSGGRNNCRTDIGIEFTKSGDAILHVDGMYQNQEWQKRLIKEYSRAVMKEVATEMGFYLESEETTEEGVEELVFVNSYE